MESISPEHFQSSALRMQFGKLSCRTSGWGETSYREPRGLGMQPKNFFFRIPGHRGLANIYIKQGEAWFTCPVPLAGGQETEGFDQRLALQKHE